MSRLRSQGQVLAIVLLLWAATAQAMLHFLVAQWTDKSGNNFCKYSNGTVLNVGINLCPLSIEG